MKDKKKFLILTIVLVALIVVSAVLYNFFKDKIGQEQMPQTNSQNQSQNDDKKEEEKEPVPAPDFTVYDKDGNEMTLSSLKGKPVVLNFWASWCGPCKIEMKDFEEAYSNYKDDIHFAMVNLTDGRRETVKTASKYIEQNGYSFPVYYDTDIDAANKYRVYSVPSTYFINSEGELVGYVNGLIQPETLQKGIDMITTESE